MLVLRATVNMESTAAIVIPAIKFGHKRYGAKGAVAAAVAVGASHVIVTRVVPRYTDVDEARIDEIFAKVSDDEELASILGEEFVERFGGYFDEGGTASAE